MNENVNVNGYLISTRQELEEALVDVQKQLTRLVKRIREKLDGNLSKLRTRLRKASNDMKKALKDAFTVESLEDYQQASSLYGEELTAELYLLQQQFTGLKEAVIAAAAPLVQVLVPAVSAVVEVLTGLARSIGSVMRTLLLGSDEAGSFSESLTEVSVAGKSVSRTLAGFDQINRLGKKTGSVGSALTPPSAKPLTGQWQKLTEQILQLLEPLRRIDLTPAAESLRRLYESLQPITRALFAGLEWAWYNLFVPLAQWTVEELLPVFLDTLTAALQALGRVIEELKPVFTWLWENCLKPLAQWAGDRVIAYLQGITRELTGVSGWIGESQGPVDRIIRSGKYVLTMLGQMAMEMLGWSEMSRQASDSFGQLLWKMAGAGQPLSGVSTGLGLVSGTLGKLVSAFGLVDTASGNTFTGLKKVWEGAWTWLKEQTVDPAFAGVKDSANSIIALINSLLRGFTTALNNMSRSVNNLGFSVPDWVPLLGGKRVSFGLQQFTAPQIPYLAQGAVLPANKPFMAVVGDQRHGTNIEAPLATIEEAVAAVMADMAAGNMAGHEATVSVLQEILQAVLGISVGDNIIGEAADRYNRKMAVVYGGY